MYKIGKMTERGEIVSDRCMAALQRMRAMSFSDSDDEDFRGGKRFCCGSGSEEEDEVGCDRGWTPGFGWRSRYYSHHYPWVRMPIGGAPPPIGPRRRYDDWLPRWNHRCISEPITCPEFPNILEEDMFWLMYLILKCQECSGIELTEVERKLYHHSVILLSEWQLSS